MLEKKFITLIALTLSIFSGVVHAENIIRTQAPIKGHVGQIILPEEPASPAEPTAPEKDGESSRYWRLLFTANNGSIANWVGIQELELRAVPGGADLTSPSTLAAASSYYLKDDLRASKAVDNNKSDYMTSIWLSAQNAQFPHWLSFDLGAPVTIREIAIWPQNWTVAGVSRSPKDFEVQTSGDGITWKTVKGVKGLTSWAVGQPVLIGLE